MIVNGMEILRSDVIIAGMVAIGILGFVFDVVFRMMEERMSWEA